MPALVRLLFPTPLFSGLTPSEWSTPHAASAAKEDRSMARRKRHSPEEIVAKLRQVEVRTGQGTPVADAIRAIGVTEASELRDELLNVEIFDSLRG